MIFKGISRVFQGGLKKTLKVFQISSMLHGIHRSFPSRGRVCFEPHCYPLGLLVQHGKALDEVEENNSNDTLTVEV